MASAGHDVRRVAEVAAGIDDRGVLQLARRETRRLLTFDADSVTQVREWSRVFRSIRVD